MHILDHERKGVGEKVPGRDLVYLAVRRGLTLTLTREILPALSIKGDSFSLRMWLILEGFKIRSLN